MKVPGLALRSLLTFGLGSLHGLILRFGVDDGLLGFLSFSLSPLTPASTLAACAAAAVASSGRCRRWVRASPRAGGGGTGGGGGCHGRGVARTRQPPRHCTFWDSARLTAVNIQAGDEVTDCSIPPRMLLLGVRTVTYARRQTQLLEVHGVLEDGHPPRVHRMLHIRLFER